MQRKSPQLAKSKVVGVRLNPHETAFVETARGSRTASTFVADLVRAEQRRQAAKDQKS